MAAAAFVDAATAQAMASMMLEPPSLDQVNRWSDEIDYMDKQCDDLYEYRQVVVPREMVHHFPAGRCMADQEWRAKGIVMSRGWQHYAKHEPEANVLLFRRVIGTDPQTGAVPDDRLQQVHERTAYYEQLEVLRQEMLLSASSYDADMFVDG
eukprot:TRINITY_DN100926_c0_g1_i1.p1 TRINITY_DN100926_c0_g1~~TRINITY_DN100926_c0_g1_i1.p1  ORF type:complete len:152 (-),score=36.66 TRINITY_DN100926_c0_g1_i1:430-885(-)